MRAPLALAFVLLAAGCVGAGVDPATVPSPGASVLAYRDVDGILQALPLPSSVATVTLHPLGVPTVEPSIAVTSSGALFVAADEDILRSTDDGATWERVQSYAKARDVPGVGNVPFTLDPWVWADAATDRVFTDHLTLACTTVAWSDDDGDTWSPDWPLACGTPLTDFQKLVTGPPGPEPNPKAGAAFGSVVYLCYNKVVPGFVAARYGLACAASYDGGRVWENEHLLSQSVWVGEQEVVQGCMGGAWIPAVAPDGTVVIRSQPGCMFRTRDSGASWQQVGTGPDFQGTIFSFDDAGTLYALSAWWDPPLRVSVSRDQGETWETPFLVQPPGAHAPMFPTLVAGAAGKLFIPLWATSEEIASGFDSSDDTVWHAWLVAVEGADTDAPTSVAYRATPDGAPMHIGHAARGMGSFFLGDFVTAAIGPDGTPYVVFPQTCNERCQGKEDPGRRDLEQLGTVVALRGWAMR
ncbi:MAG TPA: sialidase family protein [Candidatus Thermoplasmatota archaeon]|nr:sialidase family protein [Candidatus Thermoplasmatota archaeon]